MSEELHVALCGLSTRDARMVQLVLTQARGVTARHRIVIADPANAAHVGIIIVDEQSPFGVEELLRLHHRHPDVLPIFVCDDVAAKPGKFRLSRRSLLIDLLSVIDAAAVLVASLVDMRQRVAHLTPKAATPIHRLASVPNSIGAELAAQIDKAPPLTALIVDDSAAIRAQMQSALLRIGGQRATHADADEALAQSTHHHYDLILLDVVMPGKDGYQLCRELRRNPYTRSAPILMLTSRSSPFDRARGALAGCTSYLVKPVDPKNFYAVVDKELVRSFHSDRQKLRERGYRQPMDEPEAPRQLRTL
jgi:two-component system, cell cycle response regulator